MQQEINVRPLRDRVVVKVVEQEEKTTVGIYVPDNAKERPQRGVILAVGEGKLREDGTVIPMPVKVGDHILFGKYSYNEIKVDGEEYMILREDELLAVVERKGE